MADAQSSKGQRRREGIMNALKRQGRITIQEVVERFGVSEATARRDLELMEKAEPVIRTIGGAMYDGMNAVRELPFAEKEGLFFLEKERIAAAAASLITEGDVVGLSGGTTNYLLAKLLKTRRGITVVTNTVNVAMELAGSEINVVVTGGMMRHNSFELCGPLGEGLVAQLNIGKMFLGVDGVSSTGGITTYSEQEAHIARAMIRRSQATYAMFDHTKVGRTSLFSIASLAELQGFITDRELPQQLAAYARTHGIQTVVAGGQDSEMRPKQG
ncbi:DeoR/GlpR transcriptional regulator [Paenibacillus sp. MWE-103]|uniref:DeoR/GlpR transcriptional regulator n=1 Tax=Paenibacillus artemisiicola TaxID=1172618 RepID=A0ABS3WJD0_9BACL|nr:DeoR/GlpR family DNA-binding transcription regulator [Paenibacillus artemisiicola]MBO7748410.1 DeoR/GlpR transcriptional regulator [Paenibacillus artemisiicola]